MPSVDAHDNIAAMAAAALGEASGAPPLADGATRFLLDTGAQTPCVTRFAAFGVEHMTPPTDESGLPFALRDGGNGRHVVQHHGSRSVVTADGDVPVRFVKAVYAEGFSFNVLAAGVIESSGVSIILGPDSCLEKGSIRIRTEQCSGLLFVYVFTGV